MTRQRKQARLWHCTADEYHADKTALGRSEFLDFCNSPTLYERRHLQGVVEAKKQNPGMVLGSVFERMVGDGSWRVGPDSFAERTIAVWRRVKAVPKDAVPMAYSTANGQFWKTMQGVYRRAVQWGQVDGCYWTLDRDPPRGKQAYGFCRWTDFLSARHFTPIPTEVLSDRGDRKGLPWDRFSAKHRGELLLKAEEYAALPAMIAQLRASDASQFVVSHSRLDQSENTILWTDAATLVRRKCRIDLWPTDPAMDWIGDLKTTSDADLRAFAWSVIRYGYDVQAVWYLDGVEALTGKRPEKFVFVVCNTQAEHGYWCETLTLDAAYLDRARRKVDRGLAEFAACQESGVWRRKPHGKVLTLPMPPAAKYDDEWEIELETEES